MNKHLSEEITAKILLVDDKLENLVALEKTLAPLKLQVLKASSGNDALKLMLEHDFAVVLLDVMMPIMDGFEVAELMHENEATKHVPIIFLTAINKEEKYYIRGMEVGAIDYLSKPIDPIILLNKVRIFVDLYTVKNKLEKTVQTLHNYQLQLEEKNKELKQMSEEDALTKVSNRRCFEDQFLRLLDFSKNHQSNMSLLFCDVDSFKVINDQYGHSAGDFVLKNVAKRLAKLAVKDSSIPINEQENVVARVGGDEFAIIMGNLSNKSQNATDVAEKILKTIQEPFIFNENHIKVSVSIGIASYPKAAETITDLMRAADTALYQAKEAGKNRYAVFEPKE